MSLPLQRFCRKVERLVQKRALVRHISNREMTGVDVKFAGHPLELRVIIPERVNCLVAKTLVPTRPQTTLKVLEEVQHLGAELDSGSIIVGGRESIPPAVWNETEYDRQYFLPLRCGNQAGGADVDNLLRERIPHQYADLIARTLEIPVEIEYHINERPYVMSLDYYGPSEQGDKPPFHLFLHLHEITGSVYVEKIELPEEKRGRGYGSQFVDFLKWFAVKFGFIYIYLEAAKAAERFWERHGFDYVYRLNLRRERRSEQALRRRPGWERSWVGEYRLERPYWQYKNHPQDDLDFIGGLLAEKNSWKELRNIAD